MKLITCLAAMVCLGTLGLTGCTTAPSTGAERDDLTADAEESIRQMHREDPSLPRFLDRAYGYAVFPHVGKGGFIAGGAYGRGIVYEKGQLIGYADISQITIGAQAGGQSFMELVAFESQADLDRFTAGKLTFAANLSAVILKTGAAESARYTDGVAVFVEPIGGAMFEASIGGQQFTFQPK